MEIGTQSGVFCCLDTHLSGTTSRVNFGGQFDQNSQVVWDPCLLHFQKMCSVFLRYFFGRSTSRDWGISRSKKTSILGPKCISKFDMPDLQICCYFLHFDTILTSEGASKSVQILLRKHFANLLLQNVDLDGFRGSFQDPF